MKNLLSYCTLPNALSFLRIPLAFVLWIPSPVLRVTVILLSMISDSIDGTLARRRGLTTVFGTCLDPIADKFFVYMALFLFYSEHRLTGWELFPLFSRDLAVALFALWSLWSGKKNLTLKAFFWGKVMTALQFIVLIGLACNHHFQGITYGFFLLLGLFSFIELARREKRQKRNMGF